MATYTLTAGSIASMLYVAGPGAARLRDCIYLAPGKPPALDDGPFEALPAPVRDAIGCWFSELFSAPVSARQRLLDRAVPMTVEVDE